ncbi:hypothetical protein SHIRM173S_03176 [Streptomyces hirsutus]
MVAGAVPSRFRNAPAMGTTKASLRDGRVTAYRTGGTVTVEAPDGTNVTVTVPTGTTLAGDAFGEAYAGRASGWTPKEGRALAFALPESATTGAGAGTATTDDGRAPDTTAPGTRAPDTNAPAGTAPATEPAPDTRVPAGVSDPVPYTVRS